MITVVCMLWHTMLVCNEIDRAIIISGEMKFGMSPMQLNDRKHDEVMVVLTMRSESKLKDNRLHNNFWHQVRTKGNAIQINFPLKSPLRQDLIFLLDFNTTHGHMTHMMTSSACTTRTSQGGRGGSHAWHLCIPSCLPMARYSPLPR